MFPETASRVAENTSASVNRRMRQQTEESIAYYAGYPEEIDARLEELDREWDIERVLEANAATLALAGVVLGATADRRFLALSAGVTAFLLQHAIQGWCPPVPVFRRLGVRTASEIDHERYALKFLRGDFGTFPAAAASPKERARRALAVTQP
jgi:hypothetical protein